MAATRRLQKVCPLRPQSRFVLIESCCVCGDCQELQDIRKAGLRSFREIQVDEQNMLTWVGLIVPVSHLDWLLVHVMACPPPQESQPYNKGAFRIEINFPAEYPFKPPKITFKTKIYHPNIDEKGQVCLPIIQAENWKPATKTDQG